MTKTRVKNEGNIRKRSDGRYEVRITLGVDFATGEPKRISKYAATQDEAVKLLHQLSFLRDTSPNHFRVIKLGEWLDMCLEVYMRNSLKQSTYISYEGYIRNHLKPAIGDIDLKEITPRLLQEFYNYKIETEKLAPKTIININLFLHKALSFAVAEGYLQRNPTEAVNLSAGMKPQIEILTREEQAHLIQASYHHRYGVFIRLTLFTGLRLGELLGLKWEDVDFRLGLIHIRRTLNRLNKKDRPTAVNEATTEIVIQTPKTQNSIRDIPLLPQVVRDLYGWKTVQANDRVAAGAGYHDSGMIVTNPSGSYVEPRTFKDHYEDILRLAGLRHITFHALRHTFASRAVEQGMDFKTLSVIMGHYSVAFTMDTYAHISSDQKMKEMALMENLYDMPPAMATQNAYPVIITTQDDGTMYFTTPDFPAISFVGVNFQEGVQYIRERVEEELLTSALVPHATPLSMIPNMPNQVVVQISA